jgi:general secretion pathway protein F
METFDYIAVDRLGKRLTGSISASSAREARDVLKGRALTLTDLNAAKQKAPSRLQYERKISHKDLTLATRQLAILIDAATPIEEALKIAALQFEKSPMRQVILDVRARVLEGARLSDSLRHHPKTFDQLYCAMAAAGETSGKLASVLKRLASDLEAAQKVRRNILAATVYPMVLSCVAFIVVILLMVVIVPRLVQQFDSYGEELPALTRGVMAVSEWLQAYGLAAGAIMLVCIFIAARALKLPAWKKRWHGAVLKVPFIGRLTRDLNAARFARTMAGLIDAGTPSLTAMETSRHTLKNTVMRGAVDDAAVKVRGGAAISGALKNTNMFPPLVTQMVAGGEASGNVGAMFSKSADYLEGEFEAATSVFLSLLEPMIIIFLSLIILLIIGAIFLPILQLNTLAF